ncbi:MAG: glutamate 5-kinase [Thermoguttaceae bacterium]
MRNELLTTSDIVVVKVGTNVLTAGGGRLSESRIVSLTTSLSDLMRRGKRVVLVSSGAVAAGMERLGLTERPAELPLLQAVAAVGQGTLIETYERAFGANDVRVAQVLLTADDFSHRQRYLNARNALRAILDFHAIPIINENDTVSVDELHTTFGDNDRLASLVATLFESPLLILLTDVEGLFDRDPSDPAAKLVTLVSAWEPNLLELVAPKKSSRSKGGMASKLRAAKLVTESGGNLIIASGDHDDTLVRIFAGEDVGTIFLQQDHPLAAKRRWLAFAGRAQGTITLDDGAVRAVIEKRKSLLPIGIVATSGRFEKGDIVSLCDTSGTERGRGLTNYSADEVEKIRGKRSDEIAATLGRCHYEEVVHADHIHYE